MTSSNKSLIQAVIDNAVLAGITTAAKSTIVDGVASTIAANMAPTDVFTIAVIRASLVTADVVAAVALLSLAPATVFSGSALAAWATGAGWTHA